MQAIRVHETGGPEVLKLEELPTPEPGAGVALVRIEAAGLNFIDIYQRSGQYKGQLPFTLGQEAAGAELLRVPSRRERRTARRPSRRLTGLQAYV